jgi:hypothetical protein
VFLRAGRFHKPSRQIQFVGYFHKPSKNSSLYDCSYMKIICKDLSGLIRVTLIKTITYQ